MKSQYERDTEISNPDPALYNEDIAPVPSKKKNWTWWTYSAFWMAIVHNLATWTVAGSLIASGMSFWQAFWVVVVAHILTYIFVVLNSIAGTKYGIPFPVLIRAPFGHKGSLVAIILRVIPAVIWFGIYIYLGGEAINVGLNMMPWWASLGDINLLGMGLNMVFSYVICLLIHIYIVTHGIERIKRFEVWAGPIIMALAVFLLIWALNVEGIGSLVSHPSTLSTGEYWTAFLIGTVSLLGSHTTLITNIGDLSRFSRSQKDQIIGQTIGVPGMYVLFSAISLLVTLASVTAFGKAIYDPIQLVSQFGSPLIVLPLIIVMFFAVIAANTSTNAVSVGFDMTSLFPKLLNFGRSGAVACILGILSVPWLWYHSSSVFQTILGAIGAIMAPILAILLVDFFLIHKRNYDLNSLFVKNGAYAHGNGVSVRALISLAFGSVLALIGLIIPPLSFLYNYSWYLGAVGAGLCYIILMKLYPSTKDLDKSIDNDGKDADI